MKHLPAAHNTSGSRAESYRQWAELEAWIAEKKEEQLLRDHDGEVIKFRVTYVPHIIRDGAEPRPMTEQESELHKAWMTATGEERIRLWSELEGGK